MKTLAELATELDNRLAEAQSLVNKTRHSNAEREELTALLNCIHERLADAEFIAARLKGRVLISASKAA